MRFEQALGDWQGGRLTQEEAALLLGVHERTFRRYVSRFEEGGYDALVDHRMGEVSQYSAPVDEVLRLEALYRERYRGWNVRHFHRFYRREHGGTRSYTWVKNRLQASGLVKRGRSRGKHRKYRERSPLVGMMLHQDASTHMWFGGVWCDLVITLDDATGVHYWMEFVEQEGTASSFEGMRQVIENHGIPCSLYTDRGSHYWHTPKAGGKVDRERPTQFGRAMNSLNVQMIPAYSPQARGRCERMFSTHQGRLPNELAAAGITTMEEANRYLRERYMPAFNEEFAVPAAHPQSAFTPFVGELREVLCEHHERVVTQDNCVEFKSLRLQIPTDTHRYHYVRAKVRVHHYPDGHIAVFRDPRKLAEYDSDGKLIEPIGASAQRVRRSRTAAR